MLTAENATLLLIDFQQRLLPAISNAEAVVGNARRLLVAARIFGLDRVFTEQYPKGLGHTVAELDPTGEETRIEKLAFDACSSNRFPLVGQAGGPVVVCGCEAHVCVLQTVLGLLSSGKVVFVVADAIGSRKLSDKEVAMSRMAANGAEIVTTEMVLFEWLQHSGHPDFKKITALIK